MGQTTGKSFRNRTGRNYRNPHEYRWTLASEDGKERHIEMRACVLKKGSDGREVRELAEESTWSRRPQEARYEDLRELRREKISLRGEDIECRVIAATLVQNSGALSGRQRDIRRAATLWVSPASRGDRGVLRCEIDVGEPGEPVSHNWDTTFVEGAREIRVGDRTLRCPVWRIVSVARGETSTSTGESATSDEVPGGLVRSEMKTIKKVAGVRTEEVTVTEVTGFRAKPEGSD